jgi:phosphoribosylformylglycinamidine synthase
MGARGDLGLTVELDLVPQRETGMSSYEIMLSESQERMLLVADKPRAQEVLDVFAKWGLDASIVGTVTEKPNMVITQHGELVADIPNKSLTDDAPLYHRPVGVWKAPVPLDPPAHVLEELKRLRDYAADLKKLLASANICDKRWVFEQYDSMVQTNTVQGPGGEAGVMRIKGTGRYAQGSGSETLDPVAFQHSVTGKLAGLVAASTPKGEATLATGNEDAANPVIAPGAQHESAGVDVAKGDRGLAMALAGNGRWTYLDPKLGAMHAVAEAARKVACTGATPVAATNCLNFGNPEKPEIMAQLSQAIDGIAEACVALGTPVTGGNVSLYNETKGEGIYPTPVLGVVGIIDDVTKAVPAAFQRAGDAVLFLSAFQGGGREAKRDFGATDYAKSVMGELWGAPPVLNLQEEAALHKALAALAEKRLLISATDLSDGGCAVAFAKACFTRELGLRVSMRLDSDDPFLIKERLFSEIGSSVIATADPAKLEEIQAVLRDFPGVWVFRLGEVTAGNYEIVINEKMIIDEPVEALKASWSGALEEQLAGEVVTA